MTADPVKPDLEAAGTGEPYRAKKLFWWEGAIKTLVLMGAIFWCITMVEPGQSLATAAGWVMVASFLIPFAIVMGIWRFMEILSRRIQDLPTRQEMILRSHWQRMRVSAILLGGVSIMIGWVFVYSQQIPQLLAALIAAVAAVATVMDLRRLQDHQVPDEEASWEEPV
ncbi:hypothetical protein NBM05_04090 [Rothia sp. AR01]|uniref:Uncharacterized protein n=1 Tax=Rothia santali TaxID=2949643 RepID=A0A9X2KGV4_9MICC|nr:hypothetical protein [Rothia santali]MCP3425227.1 hypothetical protein [Rothia santali]